MSQHTWAQIVSMQSYSYPPSFCLANPVATVKINEVIEELNKKNAGNIQHSVTTFCDHLEGTAAILMAWGQPREIILAGLLHSIYGSDKNDISLFSESERTVVKNLIGVAAERLVYLFCTIDRSKLYSDIAQLTEFPIDGIEVVNWRTGKHSTLGFDTFRALMIVDAANVADQSHYGDLSPGLWVAKWVKRLALCKTLTNTCMFSLNFKDVGEDDEILARDLYLTGISKISSDANQAEKLLVDASNLNPMVGEPLIIAACLALERDSGRIAKEYANLGLTRLLFWNTAWDKRSPFAQWIGIANRVIK